MPNAVAQSIRAQNVIRKVWERVEWSAKRKGAKFWGAKCWVQII